MKETSIVLHKAPGQIDISNKPVFKRIAVALDFSGNDNRLIAHAVGQGNDNTHYILLHIVESAPARLLGNETDDYESRGDREMLISYVNQLRERGISASAHIGYKNRVKEIARIAMENNADLLILGAHGHAGIKDFVFGSTVNAVRHELKIPVLVVTL